MPTERDERGHVGFVTLMFGLLLAISLLGLLIR